MVEHLEPGTDQQELRSQVEELRNEMTAGPNDGFQAVDDAARTAGSAADEPVPDAPPA